MTAINDLVEKAGSPGIDVSLQALYDIALAMEGVLPGVFRIEFRVPAEPMDVKEEPEPVIVNQVDVYALAHEMEGALRDIITPEKAMAPASTPPKVDFQAPAALSVNTVTGELRERVERLEKETISLPAVYSNFYSTETIPASGPLSSSHDLPVPPHIETPYPAEGRNVEKHVEREVVEKIIRRSSIESTEQNIKKSASVVRELEDVYERLATSTIDVDSEIKKRSAIVELDNVRVIGQESLRPTDSAGVGEAIPPKEKSPGIGQTPAALPVASERTVEVPAFRLKLRVSPPSEQAADNVKQLSEARRASEPPVTSMAEETRREPAEVKAMPPLVAIAPPALVAVHNSMRVMNRYLASAAGMALRSIAPVNIPGGQAFSAPAPLVQLMLDGTAPARVSVNMLAKAGEAVAIPVPQPMLIGGEGSPAMSLAVSVAATRAMERSGGEAMANLARDTGYLPSGRDAVNGALPSHEVNNNSTSKVSNFHNTFNITVTVKGGGSEDGDLRELGKKIGRILSDEIKRYGGI